MNQLLAFALAAAALPAAAPAQEKVDLAAVHRIKEEAFQNGKVMDHLFWLTDVNGPRLTNSPGFRSAADWAVRTLGQWGASKPHLERWGDFGRGWSMTKFSARMLEPSAGQLTGVPKAWSGGTNGPVAGEVLLAPLVPRTEREDRRDAVKIGAHIARFIETWRGKLKGKVVLLDQLRELELPKEIASSRMDEKKLADLGQATVPEPLVPYEWPLAGIPADPKERQALFASLPLEVAADYWQRVRIAYYPLWKFLAAEGAVAAFTTDDRGDGGLVFAESVGGWEKDAPVPPPVVALAPESYDRLARLAEKKIAARVEVDLQARFTDDSTDGMNVVAEIPGASKKDEIVMLGAHLDSWHAGTGATDNGAGSAVMLEAFRILKVLGLPMDRTVRIALWSGEEQGLYGSRGYVREHFADPETMKLKGEHAKLAGYFNVDNGTGRIRGVYLQGNDMARPIFEAWLAPFKDLGAGTITIRNTGGTDHLSFDAVGLPGFQFIQDPLDYNTRTHHSDMDVYEHAQPSDLMQASAIVASIVYDAATRKELMPRKPLPKPLPPKRGTDREH